MSEIDNGVLNHLQTIEVVVLVLRDGDSSDFDALAHLSPFPVDLLLAVVSERFGVEIKSKGELMVVAMADSSVLSEVERTMVGAISRTIDRIDRMSGND